MADGSVTVWLRHFQAPGEHEQPACADATWDCIRHRLVRYARKRLDSTQTPQRAFDEDDIVGSVMRVFTRGIRDGQFPELENRDNLWAILFRLTKNKTADYVQRESTQKRGGGQVVAESELSNAVGDHGFSLDNLESEASPPDLVVALNSHLEQLLSSLDDNVLRQIALNKMEDRTNHDIAQRLGISLRSVERKLRLIRMKWKSQLYEEL